MRKRKFIFLSAVCLLMSFTGCADKKAEEKSNQPAPETVSSPTPEEKEGDIPVEKLEATKAPADKKEDKITKPVDKEEEERRKREGMTNEELRSYWEKALAETVPAKTLKKIGLDTPVMTQRLGADPYAIVYEGRVYLYMTGDVLEYGADKKVVANSYQQINTLNVVSSDDLVNWTDHGAIKAAGYQGAAKWGHNSWAPAVTYKEIDGVTKFFIYFANGGNGIGVLTSDSPTGPFIDPIQKPLISRATKNCGNVEWLFDPAVFVDEDGEAYIYFGGGVPSGKIANPGTGRVAKLGKDMISLDGDAQVLESPYLFEDSGINRIGDTYYYTYCTNWSVDAEGSKEFGIQNAEIAYMTSKSPMGPFTFQGVILKNPGAYYGCYGNNHHCIFPFNGDWYIAYHTQILESLMGITGGYRCTGLTKINVLPDGSIEKVPNVGKDRLVQAKNLNPFAKVEAETMATMGGLSTTQLGEQSKACGSGNMELTGIKTGSWLALYGVDFEDGAKSFTAAVKTGEGQSGLIDLRLDDLTGESIGTMFVGENQDGEYHEISIDLKKPVTGVHKLIMVFAGEDYCMDYWTFSK